MEIFMNAVVVVCLSIMFLGGMYTLAMKMVNLATGAATRAKVVVASEAPAIKKTAKKVGFWAKVSAITIVTLVVIIGIVLLFKLQVIVGAGALL